jgi:hypothetical protein
MGKGSINGGFFRIYYLLLFFLPLKIKGAFFYDKPTREKQ